MKRFLLVLVILAAHLSAAENRVVEIDLPMKDGVRIKTYLVLPGKKGKYPVIIGRSPYAKISPEARVKGMRKWKLRNFARVIQDCRGTGASEGEFIPYVNERADGLALLEWIRKQDFYNGAIYLEGSSYSASVFGSWLNTKQPDIKGILWRVQDTERYNIIYRNGFLRMRLHIGWYMNVYRKNAAIKRDKKRAGLYKFPLSGFTERVFGEKAEDLEEALLHPDQSDPFWKTPGAGGAEYSNALVNAGVPTFIIGAWHDIYITGTLDIWRKLDPRHRKNCVMVITPFDHSYTKRSRKAPPELQCPNGLLKEFAPGCGDIGLHWFEHLESGTPLKHFSKGKVSRYILFDDRWETSDDIGTGSSYCRFYLSADRKLQISAPEEGKITYRYDPRKPAAFKGSCHGNFGGVALQDKPGSRQDIISFISEPFSEDKIVEGDFKGELHVSSTAPDTCFYLRLSVVKNGRAFGLRNEIDSICRTNPGFVPGAKAVIPFKIAAHHFKVAKGDRLRLDVSSSCYPYFQLHSNFRGNQALQTQTQVAGNTVITGKSYIAIPFAGKKR